MALCICLMLGGCQCEDESDSQWEFHDGIDAGESPPADTAGGEDVWRRDISAPPKDPCGGGTSECLSNCGGQLPGPSDLTVEDGDTDAARLVLDQTGCPHVAYFQQGESDREFEVKYARWDGNEWLSEHVATATAFDWLTDLVVDEQGRPGVVYVTGERRQVHFARRDDAGVWRAEAVGSFPRLFSIRTALNPEGRPVVVVAHEDPEEWSYDLTYLERVDDGSWSREEAVTAETAVRFSGRLSFDSVGQLHMAASVGPGDHSILYMRRGEQAIGSEAYWAVDSLPQEPSVTHVGFTLDDAEQPHIVACHRSQIPAVRHHWRTSSGWQSEPVDSDATEPWNCGALAYDRAKRLHTLYGVDLPSGGLDLRHGILESGVWRVESLGEYIRGDVELQIDPRLGVAHVLAMAPPPGEPVSLSVRVARYFSFELD